MNRIKFLRELNNELQSDLAKILGVTSVAIGNYEKEKRDIPTKYLKMLAEHFNVSVDYLIGKSDNNFIEDSFKYKYREEIEGLTEEEIADALKFYKEMKKRVEENK